ncbi:MAG TPA: glycosyltransferase family 4 protein [Pyrinomonadaceae bacterium]|nr:glycosyltransferase family 4 protein [Pyrinomonadaceae bacterium]
MKKRVALITHEMSLVGGLPTMIRFLHRTLLQSGRYEPELISLATSASDEASLQLRRPASWFQEPEIQQLAWHEFVFTHVGAWGSELEFQRYRPRRNLTELLKNYDLLQFVVGCPPWVCVAEGVDRPILLWTATTTRGDRESVMRKGSMPRQAWSSLMVPITERYERRAIEMADGIFALSEYTRAILEPIAGRKRVVLAPCGVDTNRFRPAAKRGSDYVICVARLSDPRKNVDLLLRAYALLQEMAGNVPDLFLIGDAPSEEARLRLQTMGLADRVHLLGPKQGEELAEFYRNASFFVLSSDEEGLAIVILEAMASGLAVVSTDCGGPATAITPGRTGFLTPVGDARALAEAMGRLVSEPELRDQFGREGRKVVEERFSLEATGDVFLKVYDKLFNEQAPEPLEQCDWSGSLATSPAAANK